MAFYAHRCRRPECRHPDYFSSSARERGSVTRGMTYEGTPAIEWAARQPGGSMLRGSCGACSTCTKGCDYDTEVFEVTQFTNEGFGVVSERFVPPGEGTTGATRPAPIYACNCDVCREAYAARL